MAQGTKVGNIYYDLDLDDNRFKLKSAQAKQNFSDLGWQVGKLAAGLYVLKQGFDVLSSGVSSFVKNGLDVSARLETMRAGFVTLLGTAEKADAILKKIKTEAARTPFEITGLTQATQLLSAVTEDGDKALKVVLDIGEALAASGKGQAELDRIAVNLQQIGATGRATTLDIKQFAYAGIPIFKMLQKETGLAGDKLEKFIEGGGVTFEMLAKMFDKANDAGGQFFNGFKNAAGTQEQLLSNLKDSWDQFTSSVMETMGITTLFKQILNGLITFFGLLQEKLNAFMQNKNIAELFEKLNVIASKLASIFGELLLVAIQDFLDLVVVLSPYINELIVEFKTLFDEIAQAIGEDNIKELTRILKEGFSTALIEIIKALIFVVKMFVALLRSDEFKNSIIWTRDRLDDLSRAWAKLQEILSSPTWKIVANGFVAVINFIIAPIRNLIEIVGFAIGKLRDFFGLQGNGGESINSIIANSLGRGGASIINGLKNLNLNSFATGINVVPQDMFAQIHEGEAIIPKKYNPYLGNASTSQVIVNFNPSGIVARSRQEWRDIIADGIEAINEELRARGVSQIGNGKINGSIYNMI